MPPPTAPVVLIADDEPGIRHLLRATLEGLPCRVVEAASGTEAWDALARERPAVAVLDIHMPGRTGLDVCRAAKADRTLTGTHVIILTFAIADADWEAARQAGADAYVPKPFSPTELRWRVREVLRP